MSSSPLPANAATTAAVERRPRQRWTRFILPTYSWFVLLYVVFPITIVIVYAFNQSPTRLPQVVFRWQGFTLDWYRQIFDIPGLTPAFFLSLKIALTTAVMATLLGTLIALALIRYRFFGKVAFEQLLFLNIAAPEIVMGASLLGFFVTIQSATGLHLLGFPGLLIAHVMFSTAYVAITVRARMSGFDRSMEEAAQDLGATPFVTFQKVTLPLIWPGIAAGAVMAFALSIDDYVVSSFVAGSRVTFPLWVFGASRVGIPPQVFVLGTLIFMGGITLAVFSLALQRRGTKPTLKARPSQVATRALGRATTD
ncbi:MAG: ABC transporter permease [Actinomycetota bacterium]